MFFHLVFLPPDFLFSVCSFAQSCLILQSHSCDYFAKICLVCIEGPSLVPQMVKNLPAMRETGV